MDIELMGLGLNREVETEGFRFTIRVEWNGRQGRLELVSVTGRSIDVRTGWKSLLLNDLDLHNKAYLVYMFTRLSFDQTSASNAAQAILQMAALMDKQLRLAFERVSGFMKGQGDNLVSE